MIIWTRWGILVLLFAGLGVLLGFLLRSILLPAGPLPTGVEGIFIGIGLILAAPLLAVFDRLVMRRYLDKPRPMYVTQRFAQPVTAPDGSVHTERTVPAVHPDTGEPILITPSSSLFFIPVRFWPFVLGGIGILVLVINIVDVANG